MFGFRVSSTVATATTAASTRIPRATPYPHSSSLNSIHHFSSHILPTTSVSSSSQQFRCIHVKAMAETDAISPPKTGSKQALISLSDKKDLALVGNGLQELGFTIVSTGGTASALESAGVAVTKVEQLTHFPEMLDGRVKTLHPNIHGGILARRDQKHHIGALSTHGIKCCQIA